MCLNIDIFSYRFLPNYQDYEFLNKDKQVPLKHPCSFDDCPRNRNPYVYEKAAYFRAVEDRARMRFSAISHSNSRASGRDREWADGHKRNRVSSTHAQKIRARV